MECRREENRAACTCTSKDCERNGRCCECVSYHRSKGQLPGCLRQLFEGEATQTFES